MNFGITGAGDNGPIIQNEITSATIDASGRLLLTFTNTETTRDPVTTEITKLATRTYQRRFGGNGAPDPKFVGRFINRDSSDSDIESVDVVRAVSVVRPDGQIAVLERNRDKPQFPIYLALHGAQGQLEQGRTLGIPVIVPEAFAVENLTDGTLVATPDNKLIVAGVVLEGAARVPALIRFNADMSRDFAFDTNGIMRLPATSDGYQPSFLTVNADSTLNVYISDPQAMPRDGDRRALRVFQDDRPVASVRGVARKGDQIRLSVSVRGLDPIAIGEMGSDDFRLRSVGAGGSGVPTLIGLVDADEGDALLTLGVKRPRGTFDVVALARRVSDEDDDFFRAGSFGTVAI